MADTIEGQLRDHSGRLDAYDSLLAGMAQQIKSLEAALVTANKQSPKPIQISSSTFDRQTDGTMPSRRT